MITRRIREANVYSEIHSHKISYDEVIKFNPIGIILSGGPMSVYDSEAPDLDKRILQINVPILGICYGLQLISKKLGGKVEPAKDREYGRAVLNVVDTSLLFENIKKVSKVWMSHGDYLTELPSGFKVIAKSDHSPIGAVSNETEKIYGVQFHPEVVHTDEGKKIIDNFLFNICKCTGSWNPHNFIEKSIAEIKDISNPEQKRKIIGNTFIEVFEEEAKKIDGAQFLVQGTLYPDVIESVSVKGSSVTIKTHHNVGGLPEKMNLKLIEPFRSLFKDEVRKVGRELNIPEEFIERHPFPGPGLAVRILGPVDKEKLDILKEADDIYINAIKNAGIYNNIWQAFAVLLPVQSVGVMGDARTYEFVLALRAVTSVDGMTADWYNFEHNFLSDVSSKIINKVHGINRVVYDISSKPPATIEWE